jgi:hypothetical protein
MDGIAIAGIVSGISGILIAIYTHVKHSECCGLKLDTYSPNELQPQQQQPSIIINTPHNTPAHTPEQNHKQYSNESSI